MKQVLAALFAAKAKMPAAMPPTDSGHILLTRARSALANPARIMRSSAPPIFSRRWWN